MAILYSLLPRIITPFAKKVNTNQEKIKYILISSNKYAVLSSIRAFNIAKAAAGKTRTAADICGRMPYHGPKSTFPNTAMTSS